MTLDQKLLLYAQQFEDQHAPENITTTLREAAAEIERLKAENERLRAALRDALSYSTVGDMPVTIYENARAALEAAHDR